jgi:predicted dehydrogenase
MNPAQDPIRIALIGTAARSDYLYGPLLKNFPGVTLVGVWGRTTDSARKIGESLGIPWYTDLDRLIAETGAQIGIVSVSYGANGQVGLMAVEHGLHVLLETPIAHKLAEADRIIATAHARGLKIEIAEQFHRRPPEQLKLKMIEAGLFGRVYSSFNDFAGHGYHGISVMRSYLGFDAKPVQVVGSVQRYGLASHWSRLAKSTGPRDETQEHGIITFEDGRVGIFHWTSVGYDAPMRWWRSSRFLAERGMGVAVGVGIEVQEQLSTLSADGEAPQFITVERRWERNDGGALIAMIAHTGDPAMPQIRWDNPFAHVVKGHGPQWHDDEIGVAGCIKSLVDAVRSGGAPTYGPYQGRLDQELTIAIRQSAAEGGRPIQLPLDPAAQYL